MKIEQFKDEYLSQYSYAVLSDCTKEVILIDPARNPEQYFRFATENNAKIVGVIETHPHADFVSSHLEIYQKTQANIYASKLTKASYPVTELDEGDTIAFGKIKLRALNTPGHSPDSITVVLEHEGKDKAVFTGDTLFVGDCGRRDLRESGGAQETLREALARKMYTSLRDKLMKLEKDVLLYPGHGAGTLCGKALSDAESSTIGEEIASNWSLQEMPENQFVEELTSDQPFVPAYFPYNVDLNKKGAAAFEESISNVNIIESIKSADNTSKLDNSLWVIDVRNDKAFKKGHLAHSINLMEGKKFETWLGSIIKPNEHYYLAAEDEEQLKTMIERTAAIGYESKIEAAFVLDYTERQNAPLNLQQFKSAPQQYTVVDVRNEPEVKEKKIFSESISIPLAELRNRVNEIPTDKPIAVHCAGGYRSAAASSLLSSVFDGKTTVYDIGSAISEFQ
jgi:hydroxyacylglutathione hydrolase